MRREPVRIGVAGLGAIGRVHAGNLAGRIPCARLARVADTSEAALAAVCGLLEVPGSTEFDDLLEDPQLDAVLVATPPSTHAAMVERAAAAGKHVLCEKPLALEVAAAENAVEAAERAGVLLQVGFHRRFDRDFAEARARIARGELGEIRTFFGSMRDKEPPPLASPEQTLLHDAACHDLDAARWLIGEIEEIAVHGAALASPALAAAGQVDHTVMVLRFESGALGIVENSLASGYGFDCRCEITGSEATLRIDRPYVDEIETLAAGRSAFRRTATFLDRFAGAYPSEVESFARAIRGEEDVRVTGADGLAAVVLAAAAERSLELGAGVKVRSEPGRPPPDPPPG